MRNESEDCGIHLVPISVSKSRGLEQGLRKEIKYLTSLRQEYELNMLEVKKELLDEKIHNRDVEEQRQEFLEAVSKGRIQWQQERKSLEEELTEAREKIAELKSKLRLKEEVVKELDKSNNFMKHQLTLEERCPSVMPKEETVEIISLKNQLAAQTSCLERLDEHNKDLQQKVDDLVVENFDLKRELEKLQAQVSSLRQEKSKAEVRSLQENFQEGELLRKTLKEKNRASRKSFTQLCRLKKKLVRKEQLADRLVAWVNLRNKIEQARDPGEVLTIGDEVLGSGKKRSHGIGKGLTLLKAKKVMKFGRHYSPDSTTISEKVGLLWGVRGGQFHVEIQYIFDSR